jgi:hypothetical protein
VPDSPLPDSPRAFRLTGEQREQLLGQLKRALDHPRVEYELPPRLEGCVRRLLYQRDSQRHPALTDLNRDTWQRLERLRGLLDGVLQIVGQHNATADTTRYVIACESTGYLRAGSVSEWIDDLSVVYFGLEEVLHHTPRRGRGSPGDVPRKQFAMDVIEVLESYGERLTGGPNGTVARVLTFLLVAAGESATKDVSKLVVAGLKAAAARRRRRSGRGFPRRSALV